MNSYELEIPIGILFDFLGVNNQFYDAIQLIDRNVDIKTPSGEFTRINAFIKKQGFVRTYTLTNDIHIRCDEKHLVKQSNGEFIHINNAEYVLVDGIEQHIHSKSSKEYKDVFDISIDPPHEYVTTSGIICHNTSLGKLIANNLDCDLLYINASDENSVEVVREKIKSFSSAIGFKQWRLVLLDEADFASQNGQAALRNLMETFSKNCRFILTCNYVEKIIDPIQSRCQTFVVVPPNRKDVAVHVSKILTKENVSFTPEDLATIVNSGYPDIRRILNACQRQSIGGKLVIDKQSNIEAGYMDKILNVLTNISDKKKAFNDIRQILADSKIRSYDALYTFLYDNLDEFVVGHIGPVILIIAEAQYNDVQVVDKEINVAAMFVKILNEL